MSKFYKFLTIAFLFFFYFEGIDAQVNLAPSATVTASTCNTGTCASFNNLNYGTCGTQEVWIATSTPPDPTLGVNWIEWNWTSVKTINKMVIHHAQNNARFLTGGTFQNWNGTAWVTVSTFTNLPMQCINTINIPTTSTRRFRVTGFLMQGTGQLSNPNFREIEIFGPNVNNDAAVTFLTSPDICTYNQQIVAKVSNAGKKRLDSFRLYWSVNNVLQSVNYFKSGLLTGIDTTIILKSSYAFTANTTYTIKAWTFMPNGQTDSTPGNDEMTVTVNFFGNPTPPTVTNFIQCGNGRPMLSATPFSAADSILWFSAPTGGTLLGIGKTITGPYITKTSDFYAQAMKIGTKVNLVNGGATTGVNITQSNYYGGMMNITTNMDIVLDSITVRLWYNASPSDFRLYYKTGTYVGSETNPNAWTLINSGRARFFNIGTQYYARVSAKSLLLAGSQTYGIYYTVDIGSGGAGNSLYTINPGTLATTAEMSVLPAGSVIIGLFGGTQVLANYRAYMEFMYSKQCSNPSRTMLTVTVKPRPIGATVAKGSTFKGQFRIGDMTTPDVSEVGKTIVYELVPPTGYTNAGHGTTWFVSGIVAKTRYGTIVPSTDYITVPPSGSGPGTVTFTPKSKWLDSFITFSVSFADLGPYFCDSTVTRTVVVAPTPRPNFIVPSTICLGDEILFDNSTFIHSGNATYMWYFGNGDSSDSHSPVYEYNAAGLYFVKLVAKSFPWNVLHDTTITVDIGEVPDARFKVNNQCQGLPVTFQNQTTIGNGILTYVWDFGDGTPTSTSTNPTHLYSSPGAYQVTLLATANGCVSKLVKNAYLFAKPVPSFTKLSGSCLNSEFNFRNTSTIALGQFGSLWNFDDVGNRATEKDPKYYFVTSGVKNIQLRVISEFGCTDSITQAIVVRQTPTTDFTFPFACSRTPTPFNNTTNLNGEALQIYQWDFGDGFTSSATSPVKNWFSIGPRLVTLKTTLANGCSSEMTKEVVVGVQPDVSFEVEDRCAGHEVPFTNTTTYTQGNITYLWTFGDGNSSVESAPVHAYSSVVSQTYTVKLKANIAGGCADSFSKTVTIQALPTTCNFDIVGNPNASKVLPLNFVPTGGSSTGISYRWLTGDGNSITSNGTGATYKYKLHGKYCVTMVARNIAGCECSATKCVKLTTGLEELENHRALVYPNPNTGVFTVSLAGGNMEGMTVNAYNALGELVKTQTVSEGNAVVDLSDYASGVYTIQVVTGKYSTTAMVTVSR